MSKPEKQPPIRTLLRNGDRPLALVAGVVVILALAVAGVSLYLLVTDDDVPDLYDPLGKYPVQTVESTLPPDVDGSPVVPLEGPVVVSGTKCNDSTDDVTVEGSVVWQMIEPTRVTVEALSSGTGTRIPGCESFIFSNDVPDGVVAATTRAYDDGATRVVWQIRGREVPLDPDDGHDGRSRTWETENFTLVE